MIAPSSTFSPTRWCAHPLSASAEHPGEVGGLGADEPRHGVALLALGHDDRTVESLDNSVPASGSMRRTMPLAAASENSSLSSIDSEAWLSVLSATLTCCPAAGTTVMPQVRTNHQPAAPR